MTEEKIARTEPPRYEVAPFLSPDFFRTGLFDTNPFTLMRRFSEQVDRAFGKTAAVGAWRPAIELKREKGKLLIHAELPGLKKENVKVTVIGDVLEIEGEREFESKETGNNYVHTERNYGRFYRAIPLPEEANGEKALAEFANGVLEISIPIPEVNLVKKEITVADAKAKAEVKH